MKNNENGKSKIAIIIIILLIIIIAVLGYLVYKLQNDQKTASTQIQAYEKQITELNSTVEKLETTLDSISNTINSSKASNYFMLYDGYEVDLKTGVQVLSDMKLNEENKTKYNIDYYNIENGKFVENSKGDFSKETYQGAAIVSNTKRIAFSKKFDAIPREFKKIDELPNELMELADYTKVELQSIDLDGDGKTEYIACCQLDYSPDDHENGEPSASSIIMLFDNNYKKIANLAELKEGYYLNSKTFLSLDNVDYIDIDSDNIMEILIKLPMYEGYSLSILKYANNKVEGETNYQVSLKP